MLTFKINKFNIKSNIFIAVYSVWIICNMFYATTMSLPLEIMSVLIKGVAVLLIFLILCANYFYIGELLCFITILVLVLIASYNGGGNALIFSFLFIFASKKIDFNKIVDIASWIYLSGIIFVILLAVTGKIDNNITYRIQGTSLRIPMGFTHVNTFGAYILQTSLLWYYKKFYKFKWYDYVSYIAIILYLALFVDSRTPIYILAFALIFMLFFKFTKRLPVRKVLDHMFVISASLSIILSIVFTQNNAILNFLNESLSERIKYMSQYFYQYGFSLFGQNIYLVSSIESRQNNIQAGMLDNSYMHMGIRYGVIFLLIFIFAYTKLLKRTLGENNLNLYVCLVLSSIYYFMESGAFVLVYNFTLLALPQVIFRQQCIRKNIFINSQANKQANKFRG